MNYYELFEIPFSFQVDASSLKPTFYALSRQFHPDFAQGADAGAQEQMLQQSALLNQAYKTFQQPDATIGYALQLLGAIEADEKYALDSEFLMEVMDLNEQLMEWEMEENPETLVQIQQTAQDWMDRLETAAEPVLKATYPGTVPSEVIAQVKEYYYQKKYIRRILDRMAGGRNIATPNAG